MNKLWMVGAITVVVIVFWILMRYPPEEMNGNFSSTESKEEIVLPTTSPINSEETPSTTMVPSLATQSIDKIIGSTHIVGNRAVFLIDNNELDVINGEDMVMSPEVAGKVKVVADWQYYEEKALTEMEVAADTEIIGIFAFARSGLQSVVLPEGLKKIEYAAFYHCDSLENVIIPKTVTTIEAEAFSFTPWMENFISGNTIGQGDFLIVGDGILLAYRGRTAEVIVPEGVKYIAANCFFNHTEIERVIFPSTLQTVDSTAFDGCHYKPAF